jgi:hypothetical protein
MSTLRFALIAAGLLALAFIGVSWAQAGFPILTFGVSELKPNPKLPTFEQAREKAARENWVNSKTNQSDGNVDRDKLRSELLQASTAYKLSPCDDMQKKNLVEAMSNYVNAWHDMAFCKSGVGDCPSSYDQRLDTAAAAFKTPADKNLQNALREAISQGGISRDDFPEAMRRYVFIMSGSPPTEPRAACHANRKAASRP